jgi:hypothetical protein
MKKDKCIMHPISHIQFTQATWYHAERGTMDAYSFSITKKYILEKTAITKIFPITNI